MKFANFLNARYVGSTEAMWRILEYPIISRMYEVSPKEIELFHLRLLLLDVTGP